jgi:hypothetical protein
MVVDMYQYRAIGQQVICFSKIGFLAMVINCTAGMEVSRRICRLWWQLQRGIWVCETSEALQGVLSGGVPSLQVVGLK